MLMPIPFTPLLLEEAIDTRRKGKDATGPNGLTAQLGILAACSGAMEQL
jgi:hypothetical protein